MKNLKFLLLFLLPGMILTGCGNNEPPKKEENQPQGSDIFKDEQPAYDAKAIDPKAEVVSLTLKAEGTSMADMHYDQKEISINKGTTVKLKFINTMKDAAMPHNWVLVYDGKMEAVAKAGLEVGKEGSYVPASNDVLIATHLLGPGEETEITFPTPPPGKYQFVCTYPGHWSVMNGTLTVN